MGKSKKNPNEMSGVTKAGALVVGAGVGISLIHYLTKKPEPKKPEPQKGVLGDETESIVTPFFPEDFVRTPRSFQGSFNSSTLRVC